MELSKFKNVIDSAGGLDGLKKGISSVSGMFSKSKDQSSTAKPGVYSPELENLISMILEEEEVTDRQLEMLAARAKKEGIDPLEFEITLQRRLRQQREQKERFKNPVTAISEAFKMAEAISKGDKSAFGSEALTAAMSLIPGVGQVSAIGSLASSLIKTPSNLNALKAEIISNASIPEDEGYLSDFMLFCFSQKEIEIERAKSNSKSVSGIISSLTVGDSLDLIPIWTTKLNHLIAQSRRLYPNSELIKSTISQVYESTVTRLKKIKARKGSYSFECEIKKLTAPDDNQELLELVAFLFENSTQSESAKLAHKNMYQVAERRFHADSALLSQLKLYKVKRFGLF